MTLFNRLVPNFVSSERNALRHDGDHEHRSQLEQLEDRTLLSTTVVVDTTLDVFDAFDGVTSLREAITITNGIVGTDTITFDNGVFGGGGTITMSGTEMIINDDLEIDASGQSVTIDGDDLSRIFSVTNSDVTMTGLALTGGQVATNTAIALGGAMYVFNSTLNFNDGSITDSRATDIHPASGSAFGGAIYSLNSNTTISNSTLSGNSAVAASTASGGAIWTGGTGFLNIRNNSVIHNNNTTTSGSGQTGFGGGITAGNDLGIENATISGNSAVQTGGGGATALGGGVYAFNGLEVIIEGSTFDDNGAVSGGGMYLEGTTSLATISDDSTFSNNSAFDFGGGVYANLGNITIWDSTFSSNGSSALYTNGVKGGREVVIRESTFSGNTGTSKGGAAYFNDSVVAIRNSTISGNSAASQGGGLYQTSSTVTITNSTIVLNSASSGGVGGGISGDMVLRNTIVAGNSAMANFRDLDGTFTGQNNLIGDPNSSGGFSDGTNGNIVGSGGGFITLANVIDTTLADNGGDTETHALVSGSVAINAGDNSMANLIPLNFDQLGENRIVDGTVDIGSVEFVDPAPVITSSGATTFLEEGTGTAYTITATDDKPGLTYGINSWDAPLFNVNGSTGEITFKSIPDYDSPLDSNANNVYILRVLVTDSDGNTTSKPITISVTDDLPVLTSPDSSTVPENSTGAAYTIAATDDDPAGVTYSINSWDSAQFNVNSTTGEITFKTIPDYENPTDSNANNVYILRVVARDANGNSVSKAITIKVTDDVPVITSGDTVDYEDDRTDAAYTITATDDDKGLNYGISRWDSGLFDVNSSGEITFKNQPDFDSPEDSNANNVYVLWVFVTDPNGNVSGKAITIKVIEPALPAPLVPVITSPDRVTFTENGVGAAYTITATSTDTLTYSIGRWDQGDFNVNSATGEVTFKTIPDYENPADSNTNNIYVIWVTATDTFGGTAGKAVVIEVLDEVGQ